MIGVTIGIGPVHKALASISAKCFNETTGLEVVILTEKELRQTDLLHPAALKLKVFDFVKDDSIIYFDADWFSVKQWNPTIYENDEEIIACHDFISNYDWPEQYSTSKKNYIEYCFNNDLQLSNKNHLRTDYIEEIEQFIDSKDSFTKWINTGFWIVNRNNHFQWLEYSLKYYIESIGHHFQYYEQPAMNVALMNLNLKVKYLDRKYNILVATRKKWPDFLIGLHVKIKHNGTFSDLVMQNKITNVEQVKDYFQIELKNEISSK